MHPLLHLRAWRQGVPPFKMMRGFSWHQSPRETPSSRRKPPVCPTEAEGRQCALGWRCSASQACSRGLPLLVHECGAFAPGRAMARRTQSRCTPRMRSWITPGSLVTAARLPRPVLLRGSLGLCRLILGLSGQICRALPLSSLGFRLSTLLLRAGGRGAGLGECPLLVFWN